MKQKRKTFIAIGVVIIVTIFFHYIGLLRPIEHTAHRTFLIMIQKPVDIIHDFIKNKSYIITHKKELINYIEELEYKIKQHKIDTIELAELTHENALLREQLNFFEKNRYPHMGAQVIGRTIDPLGTTLIIDRGSADGLIQGNPAIVHNGILIGKIIEVTSHNAVIRLINDNTSKIGATILNNERSIGLVEGGYGLGVRMNFIPQNEIVTPGDTIITSGLSEGIPRGLLIGTVELVEKQPHEPFQQAVINPLTDMSDIDMVSIIMTYINI